MNQILLLALLAVAAISSCVSVSLQMRPNSPNPQAYESLLFPVLLERTADCY